MTVAYEILNVEQGSELWLKERLKKVTASQVPVILGLSAYQTPLELFDEKISGKVQDVDAFKKSLFEKGHSAERAGREWAESHLGISLAPAVLVSKRCPDLLASLDGFNEQERLNFEAKYMGVEAIEALKQGKIKPDHEYQVQAQLLVSGADKCLYFATDAKGDAAILYIKPKAEYQDRILESVEKFMKDLKAGKSPEPTERDFKRIKDNRFDELYRLKLLADETTKAYQGLKDALVEEYQHKRIKASGLLITRTQVKGAIDYAKVPELRGVDLEAYRKKPIERVDIRLERKS